jgi:hypothetical protein
MFVSFNDTIPSLYVSHTVFILGEMIVNYGIGKNVEVSDRGPL